jgi:hypothetical protein
VFSEEGSRKVWRYLSSEEDLGARISAAKTDEERKALLDANQELITVELDEAMLTEGDNLISHGSYSQGGVVFEAVESVASYWAPFVIIGNGR